METTHTPEPWEIKRHPNEGWGHHYLVVGANHTGGTEGIIFHEFDHGQEIPEWERIVACVNACAGIEKPEEYMKGVKILEKTYHELQNRNGDLNVQISTLKAQRDELLAALEGVVEFTTPEFAEKWGFAPQRHAAKNALLKAKGGR